MGDSTSKAEVLDVDSELVVWMKGEKLSENRSEKNLKLNV